jgi:hypothetical protein
MTIDGSAINHPAPEAAPSAYEQESAVESPRPGDPVRMCLTTIPRNCPPGDNRGREYETSNLRTHRTWRLLDSEHMCGGA